MSLLRKILFYAFFALYLAICPFVILYAFGYILSPKTQQVVQSGVISLDTIPQGASVYFGKSRFKHNTPATIRGLLPGVYPIRIVLKGYRPWEKTVEVETGKATAYKSILLVPESTNFRTLLEGGFRDMIPLAGEDKLILAKGRNLEDYGFYDPANNTWSPWAIAGEDFRQAIIKQFYFFPGSQIAVAKIILNGADRFIVLSLAREPIESKDITGYVISEPEAIVWDPDYENYLYVRRGDTVDVIDLKKNTKEISWLSGIKGFGVHGRDVMVIDSGNAIKKCRYDSEESKLLLADPLFLNPLFGEQEQFDIVSLTDDLILFRGDRGKLLMNRLPYILLDKGLENFVYDEKRKKILIWTKTSIGIVDIEHKDEELIFERGPRVEWIYQNGTDIQKCFWLYKGTHVLFCDGKNLSMAELNDGQGANIVELVKLQNPRGLFYSDDNGAIRFVDPDSGAVLAYDLVPEKERQKMFLPELAGEREKEGDQGR